LAQVQRIKYRAAKTKIAPKAHQNTIFGKRLSALSAGASLGSCMGMSMAGIVLGCSIDRPKFVLFESLPSRESRACHICFKF
jgi:hypothetical protein